MTPMTDVKQPTRFRFWLWLIRIIGVIVPRRIRADWQLEWEAELQHRELLLAEWDRLNWRNKVDLLWRRSIAFCDPLSSADLRQPARPRQYPHAQLRHHLASDGQRRT